MASLKQPKGSHWSAQVGNQNGALYAFRYDGIPTAPPAPTPAPTPGIPCNPKATPPETCPGGTPCPQCGQAACHCPAPSRNECNPAKTCNVCAACCHQYVVDGGPCDQCVASECGPSPPPPVPYTGRPVWTYQTTAPGEHGRSRVFSNRAAFLTPTALCSSPAVAGGQRQRRPGLHGVPGQRRARLW